MINKQWLGGLGLATLLCVSPLASARLTVINLGYDTTDKQLENFFSQYGKVANATIVIDRETGRSRGFGYVDMEDVTLEDGIIEQTNEKHFLERVIRVHKARTQGGDRPARVDKSRYSSQ